MVLTQNASAKLFHNIAVAVLCLQRIITDIRTSALSKFIFNLQTQMSFRSVLSAITCALFTLHTHGRVNEISKELSANQDNVLVFALGMNPGGELAINLLKHESIHGALYKGDDATPLKQFL
eukprot:299476_1